MESLNLQGLFVDDLKRLRIMEPQTSELTQKLARECESFDLHVTDFSSLANTFISLTEQALQKHITFPMLTLFMSLFSLSQLSASVEQARLRAVGAANLLKSAEKQRVLEQQRLKALITERERQLANLDSYLDSLENVKKEQLERIAHITQNQ